MSTGFEQGGIEPTRIYRGRDITGYFEGIGLNADAIISYIEGKFESAFIRARNPAVPIR